MFAVKPFRELRSAISVERAWRGLSPSHAVGAWSLVARQEARKPTCVGPLACCPFAREQTLTEGLASSCSRAANLRSDALPPSLSQEIHRRFRVVKSAPFGIK